MIWNKITKEEPPKDGRKILFSDNEERLEIGRYYKGYWVFKEDDFVPYSVNYNQLISWYTSWIDPSEIEEEPKKRRIDMFNETVDELIAMPKDEFDALLEKHKGGAIARFLQRFPKEAEG